KTDKMTKADAVRAAVKEGVTDNSEIVSFAKAKFGLDVTTDQVSTYKSLDKKRAEKAGAAAEGDAPAEKRGPGRPPGPKAAATGIGTSNQTKTNGSTAGNGSPAELALAVKQLIATYGVESVTAMTKVFAE